MVFGSVATDKGSLVLPISRNVSPENAGSFGHAEKKSNRAPKPTLCTVHCFCLNRRSIRQPAIFQKALRTGPAGVERLIVNALSVLTEEKKRKKNARRASRPQKRGPFLESRDYILTQKGIPIGDEVTCGLNCWPSNFPGYRTNGHARGAHIHAYCSALDSLSRGYGAGAASSCCRG